MAWILADDIAIEDAADLLRSRNAIARFDEGVLVLLADDVHAQLDAFIADEHGRTGNQLADLMLALAAKGAVESVLLLSHFFSPSMQDPSLVDVLALARCSLPTFGDMKTPNEHQHASVQQIKIGLMDRTRPHLASGGIATVMANVQATPQFKLKIHQMAAAGRPAFVLVTGRRRRSYRESTAGATIALPLHLSGRGLDIEHARFGFIPALQNLIDEPEVTRLLGREEVIAIERLLDHLVGLAGVLDVRLVEPPLHLDDVLGVALDIGGLTGETARGLMHHDAGVRQRVAHALFTSAKQQRPHRCRLADAQRRNRRLHELHGVVDRHARRDDTARRVDVHRNFFLRVLGLEKQKLHADRCRHVVLDRTGDEDDALLQQARRQVVAALAARRLFDHHGPERVRHGVDRIAHCFVFPRFSRTAVSAGGQSRTF